MKNSDDDPLSTDNSSYQFFSDNLNYKFFEDQPASEQSGIPNISGGVPNISATGANISTGITTDSKTTLPSRVVPGPQATPPSRIVSGPQTVPPAHQASARGVVPDSVPASTSFSASSYLSLTDEPEPTFEERVAAMNAASAPIVQQAEVVMPTPARIVFPEAEEVVSSLQDQPLSNENNQNSSAVPDDLWHPFAEPGSSSGIFSPEFNFNRSLLKIFWRIDIDHNNRVSKNELGIALQEKWFDGDDRLLAQLLYESYEDISPEAIFCDAGLSVNNICSYGPFVEMAALTLESTYADTAAAPVNRNNPKRTKSSKSLRNLFKKR